MSNYPEPVQKLHDALLQLPGIKEAELGLQSLEGIDETVLSLPGEFADLPHVAIRRTNGGQKGEILVTAKIRFRRNQEGWIALEFLAWWVRDLSRSGNLIQMRPLALPPVAYEVQLGRTLQFVIEFFFVKTDEDNRAILEEIGKHADSLAGNLEDYKEALANPVSAEPAKKPLDLADFRHRAEAGDMAGQFSLALCHFQGQGTPKNYEEAVRWFTAAAEQGHPGALTRLAWCLKRGAGVEKNVAKAVECYAKAAEAGDGTAMGLLGLCYENGTGVAEDIATAVTWYRKGAEAGDPQSQHFLAMCCANGQGVKKDLAAAASWYAKSAAQGWADAKFRLGMCCAEGEGVPVDLEKAFGLYREAALGGVTAAFTFVGGCYEDGKGVAKDDAEAAKWYRLGAEKGNPVCQANLGECHELGRGVEKNLQEALKLYRAALEQGFDPVKPAIERVEAMLK